MEKIKLSNMKTLTFIPSDFNDLKTSLMDTEPNQFDDGYDCPFMRAYKRAVNDPDAEQTEIELKYKIHRIDAIRRELLAGAESVTVNL